MKIKKVIAAALSLFMLGGAYSYNAPAVRDYSNIADAADDESEWIYTNGIWSYTENDDGTINIIDCGLTDEEIVFPATLNGKAVKAIKVLNLQEPSYQDTIKSAVISEGIEEVGSAAFEYCIHLQKVSIPESVKRIDTCAFICCLALESITIPESVETIHYAAFKNCEELTSVTIPENVKAIGNSAFMNCDKLTDITILNTNCYFDDYKETLSDPSHCTVHGYKGSTAEEFAIKWGYKFKSLEGDVNYDGEITVADAVLLQKWLLAVPDTHLPYWRNADLCADEKLNVFDLCLLKRQLIENATYTIRLEDVGEHKSSVVSIVYKYLGCSLNEAKNIVNAAPVNITDSATKADVDQLTADLELVGATISVTLN